MYHNIVILTGAGISAESGIKTFRDSDGLWENHRIEDVASPEGFARNPDLVLDFYNQRRRQLIGGEVAPNGAHQALARLEANLAVTIVTQNVDNLHERAGSKNVIHMHGELLKMKCAQTEQQYSIEGDFLTSDLCDCFQSSGNLRPDIVWFGEMPYHMERIIDLLERCDLFVAIGTSGQVYPAAGFVRGLPIKTPKLEINTLDTAISDDFDLHLKGPASEKVAEFVDAILAGKRVWDLA